MYVVFVECFKCFSSSRCAISSHGCQRDASHLHCCSKVKKTCLHILVVVHLIYRMPRKCTQSIELGQTMICEDEYLMIAIPIHLFNRNNQVWGDPEVFHPERWCVYLVQYHVYPAWGNSWCKFRFSDEKMTANQKCHFMPFGQGPRSCIGVWLAMIENKAAIATILPKTRFPFTACVQCAKPVCLLFTHACVHFSLARRTTI